MFFWLRGLFGGPREIAVQRPVAVICTYFPDGVQPTTCEPIAKVLQDQGCRHMQIRPFSILAAFPGEDLNQEHERRARSAASEIERKCSEMGLRAIVAMRIGRAIFEGGQDSTIFPLGYVVSEVAIEATKQASRLQ